MAPSLSIDPLPPPTPSVKQRQRKGSLRKTALLAPRKFRNDGTRSRRGSSNNSQWRVERGSDNDDKENQPTMNGNISSSSSTARDEDLQDAIHEEGTHRLQYTALEKITSTTSVSSTDDDDALLSFGTKVVLPAINNLHEPQSPSSTSTTKSSLTFPPSSSSSLVPPETSDSTTAFYGYLLLVVTWITFVIGIGSCLDIWSWAWDVGTTPPAPPELHDDETLPITGYYPALLILTGGVVSWVWCGFAWVGMKYFRHAKEGEG